MVIAGSIVNVVGLFRLALMDSYYSISAMLNIFIMN